MSLREPPHLDARVYVTCTCGTMGLYHSNLCAVLDPNHPSWIKAQETVERNARYWFGPKKGHL